MCPTAPAGRPRCWRTICIARTAVASRSARCVCGRMTWGCIGSIHATAMPIISEPDAEKGDFVRRLKRRSARIGLLHSDATILHRSPPCDTPWPSTVNRLSSRSPAQTPNMCYSRPSIHEPGVTQSYVDSPGDRRTSKPSRVAFGNSTAVGHLWLLLDKAFVHQAVTDHQFSTAED